MGLLPEIPQARNLLTLLDGDRLRLNRVENLKKLAIESEAYRGKIEASRWTEPSLSVVVPLLIAAADEERADLRRLWASLLANAAIDGGRKVRRGFFETLKKMEPLDAVVLSVLGSPEFNGTMEYVRFNTALDKAIGCLFTDHVDELERDMSLEALATLGCVLKRPRGRPVVSIYGRAVLRSLNVS